MAKSGNPTSVAESNDFANSGIVQVRLEDSTIRLAKVEIP